MKKQIVPFVINSNLCMSTKDIADYSSFMTVISGNTGNSYITWALLKETGCTIESIKGHHIDSLYSYDFANQKHHLEIIETECTHVFLVLQDQIRIQQSYNYQLPYREWISFLSKIKKPILAVGLGANSLEGFVPQFHKKLNPELICFLQFLSQKCRSIGIRGHYTEEILWNLGIKSVSVIGCPSYYETGRNRIINKPISYKDIKLGISSGTNLSKCCSGIYLQDMQNCESRIIKAMFFGERIMLSRKELRDIKKGKYRFFSSINNWKKDVAQMDFYAGLRVHGSMVALNSGVPTVVMNSDSRAREMCEYMNIPYHPELRYCKDIEKIIEICNYDKMNKEYNQKFDKFLSFLSENQVEIDIFPSNEDFLGGVELMRLCNIEAYPPKIPEYIRQIFLRIFARKGSEERSRAIELIKL